MGEGNAAAWGRAHETTPGRWCDHEADVNNNAMGRWIGNRIDAWWLGTAMKTACRECKKALKRGGLDRHGG
jgi:hypothetical protein